MTDFRALCAEILAILDDYENNQRVDWDDWRSRTRTALSQPEPQGPTDKELHQLWQELYSFHDGPTSGEVAEIARAVLARYARPAIEPVAVAERLPGAEDCDAEGRCWWWIVDDPGQFPYWICAPVSASGWAGYTQWLPCRALPVPQQGE